MIGIHIGLLKNDDYKIKSVTVFLPKTHIFYKIGHTLAKIKKTQKFSFF
jgi:hypothetical protein